MHGGVKIVGGGLVGWAGRDRSWKNSNCGAGGGRRKEAGEMGAGL